MTYYLVVTTWPACWLIACLTSQQQASVYQGRICTDNFTCCHTEIQVADQTFYLTQSQYTDTEPTRPSADPIAPGAWQGSHWSANLLSHWYDSTQKNPVASGIRIPDLPLSRRTPFHMATEAVTWTGVVEADRARVVSQPFGQVDQVISDIVQGQ